ncbi:hypothetical protein [Pseudomonas sp. RGM2987]|uniref:hypothetical protein n=1 Tax=Pseudomonas sp. RGM2987 TaxID=2930090 RepID=UPI001FD65CD9|nr:hypothetical protein [Pseudomonas sp. RGM2987]MCJ8207752.1 hypothetical protein [Pseudomonas sp. RGM2987]
MYFLITPRRKLGVAIPKDQLKNAEAFRGNIIISESLEPDFGRAAVVAKIFNSGPDPDNIPPLLDVKITGMAQGGMNLTGVEKIGDAFYAQSWWCRAE